MHGSALENFHRQWMGGEIEESYCSFSTSRISLLIALTSGV